MLVRVNQLEEQVASLKAENDKEAEDFRLLKAAYQTEKETIMNRMDDMMRPSRLNGPALGNGKSPMQKITQKKRISIHRREEEELQNYNLSTDDCGLSMAVDSTAFSAQDSEPGDWPWMAHISLTGGDEDTNSCGGFLISENQILSAAHCFNKLG